MTSIIGNIQGIAVVENSIFVFTKTLYYVPLFSSSVWRLLLFKLFHCIAFENKFKFNRFKYRYHRTTFSLQNTEYFHDFDPSLSEICVFNQQIYIVSSSGKFCVYDPMSKRFNVLANNTEARAARVFVWENAIHAIESDKLHKYNMEANSWSFVSSFLLLFNTNFYSFLNPHF